MHLRRNQRRVQKSTHTNFEGDGARGRVFVETEGLREREGGGRREEEEREGGRRRGKKREREEEERR